MRTVRVLRSALALTGTEWQDFFGAQIALLRAQYRVRRYPVGQLVGRVDGPADDATGDAQRAEQLARALDRAARYGVLRPLCLVRSIALRDLLQRRGIRGAMIRIGVRREAGEFQAHAWVRWGTRILGDDARFVARFVEVNDLRVFERG